MEHSKARKRLKQVKRGLDKEEVASSDEANSVEKQALEDRVRLARLRATKEKFLQELRRRDPDLKSKPPQERMRILIEKSEKLANFLLTKHIYQETRVKENKSASKNHIMYSNKERRRRAKRGVRAPRIATFDPHRRPTQKLPAHRAQLADFPL